jgi:hypothetical protein
MPTEKARDLEEQQGNRWGLIRRLCVSCLSYYLGCFFWKSEDASLPSPSSFSWVTEETPHQEWLNLDSDVKLFSEWSNNIRTVGRKTLLREILLAFTKHLHDTRVERRGRNRENSRVLAAKVKQTCLTNTNERRRNYAKNSKCSELLKQHLEFPREETRFLLLLKSLLEFEGVSFCSVFLRPFLPLLRRHPRISARKLNNFSCIRENCIQQTDKRRQERKRISTTRFDSVTVTFVTTEREEGRRTNNFFSFHNHTIRENRRHKSNNKHLPPLFVVWQLDSNTRSFILHWIPWSSTKFFCSLFFLLASICSPTSWVHPSYRKDFLILFPIDTNRLF